MGLWVSYGWAQDCIPGSAISSHWASSQGTSVKRPVQAAPLKDREAAPVQGACCLMTIQFVPPNLLQKLGDVQERLQAAPWTVLRF